MKKYSIFFLLIMFFAFYLLAEEQREPAEKNTGQKRLAPVLKVNFSDKKGISRPNHELKINNVDASSIEGEFITYNMIDNDTATRWNSLSKDPQWVILELDKTCMINKVIIEWEAAYGKSYEIQVSEDEKNWNTVYSTETGREGKNICSFLKTRGKYVKIYCRTRGTNWGYSIYEVKIYGFEIFGR